jgi:hypothetical protein
MDAQGAEKRCRPWFDKLTMRAKPLKTRNLMVRRPKAISNYEPVEASSEPVEG